jgi:hypothetical protein
LFIAAPRGILSPTPTYTPGIEAVPTHLHQLRSSVGWTRFRPGQCRPHVRKQAGIAEIDFRGWTHDGIKEVYAIVTPDRHRPMMWKRSAKAARTSFISSGVECEDR